MDYWDRMEEAIAKALVKGWPGVGGGGGSQKDWGHLTVARVVE